MRSLIILAVVILGLTSCKKLEDYTPDPNSKSGIRHEIHIQYKYSTAKVIFDNDTILVGDSTMHGLKVLFFENDPKKYMGIFKTMKGGHIDVKYRNRDQNFILEGVLNTEFILFDAY